MTRGQKVVGREREKTKQETLENSCAPLRKKRGRKQRSPSPPSPHPTISFFKVMFGDFRDTMPACTDLSIIWGLYIPPMAALKLKDLDKKYVYIEDANGKNWDVKMSMVDGFLAFQKGWDEFLSAHSITVGEVVLFTYTGGFSFNARIFGTSSLERVDFQMKKTRGKKAKERCTAELKPDNVRPSKEKKASHASEVRQSPSGNELIRILRKGKESAQFDFPNIVESDAVNGVLEVPSSCEETTLRYDSNSKESENELHSFEQTWEINVDPTVEEVNKIEELNIISPTKQAKSDAESNEASANKTIKNMVVTKEKSNSLFHSGITLVSKQEKELDTMTKSGTCTFIEHSDIKEELPETSDSLKMETCCKMEENNSDNLEMLDSKPHNANISALSNPVHAECSTTEFNVIDQDEIVDKVVQTADIICRTLDEKLAKLTIGTNFVLNSEEEPICQKEHATFGSEIGVPCKTISVVSSNPLLISASNKKENLKPTNGECGIPQIKESSTLAESCLQINTKVLECKYKRSNEIGIRHDAFSDVDEKNDTPRSRVVTERRVSVDLPPSNCASFSVCVADDVQSFFELPNKLTSHMGKLKNGRKIVVLQDLSMKCWPVLYHQNLSFIGFIGGWMDFARANNICRGDICEFELVNKMELKFRVQIMKQEESISNEKVVDRC